MKKIKHLLLCGCILVVAALVAVYGGNFSWRQVLIGGLALLICQSASEEFERAFRGSPFRRYQFRVDVGHLARAIEEAGIYGDAELSEAMSAIFDGMAGHGSIIFTWLEPELFYINTTKVFSSSLKLSIDLPAFGSRVSDESKLRDLIEMRSTMDGYELVLLTSEQRYCWPDTTRDKGIVMFRIPYEALWALQGGESWLVGKKVHPLLSATGLEYNSIAEVPDAWDYRNAYGSFRWWDV